MSKSQEWFVQDFYNEFQAA